jgi:hypothetical protein
MSKHYYNDEKNTRIRIELLKADGVAVDGKSGVTSSAVARR